MKRFQAIFKHELQVYRARLSELLGPDDANEGLYVVICRDTVHGPYGSYEDGLTAGYDWHELTPFLLKKIERKETVHWL